MAKLLLVEDDNNLREIYEARLQAEGYTIMAAKDGEEALVLAKAEKPDLIISDVMMPKISGFEMLDILRNTDELKAVKIIMLTALGQSDDQQRADRLGADRYLVKSQVTLEDIVKVAHELLEDQAGGAGAATATTTDAADSASTAAPTASPTSPTAAPAAASTDTTAAATSTAAAASASPAAEPPTPIEPSTLPGASTDPAATSTSTAPTPVKADEPAEPKPAAATTAASAEPVVIPVAVDPSAPGTAAFSTAQEEATIEAKIEDFVAGASSDPGQPGTVAPTPTAPQTADDKPPAASASADADATPDATADDASDQTDSGTKDKIDKTSDSPTSDDSTPPSTHKKVITPIDHHKDSKADIHTLADLEDIAEQTDPATAPPIAAIVSDENGPPSAPVIQPTTSTANQAADITAAAAAPIAGTVLTPPADAADHVDPNTIAL
jgi:CheY-like chemotaxis protein